MEAPFSKFGRVLFASFAAFVLVCLTSCGSSASKVDEFIPSRIVVIGDSYSYLGSSANGYKDRITVNDGGAVTDGSNVNNWVLQIAGGYALSKVIADGKIVSGIVDSVTAAIDVTRPLSCKPTSFDTLPLVFKTDFKVADIVKQIDCASISLASTDLLLVNGGVVDIYKLAEEVVASTKTQAAAEAGAKVQAHALRDYVKNLIATTDVKHIMLLSVPSLDGSPYQIAGGAALQAALIGITDAFNTGLFEQFGTQPAGSGVRSFYSDNAFKSSTTLVSLGINMLNSKFCDGSVNKLANPKVEAGNTGCTDANNAAYKYATEKYPTPVMHRLLGNMVYNTMRGYSGW
ncbi:MAG: hypothetical protein EBT78_15705 [Betaproteobacteria bacterium]|nr:hypothetical protein [Betaproteobacteria bacterium]